MIDWIRPSRAGGGAAPAVLAVLLGLGSAAALQAWGQEGHRITAEVAQRHLGEAARQAALETLGGESLAQAATWPDEIRSYPSWDCAKPFHFVTIAIGADYPDRGVAEGDSVEALVFFIDQLRDPATDPESRRIALSFIVHLVGDIHQPLHVGRGCDHGGNSLEVSWFGDSVNFHTVWDSLLIQQENLSFGEWADFLDPGNRLDVEALPASTPLDWVAESQGLLDGAYSCFTDYKSDKCPCFCGRCQDGTSTFGGCRDRECASFMAAGPARLAYAYKAVNLPVVRRQLLRGGLRLARLLDWVLPPDATPPPEFAAMAEQIRNLPDYRPEVMAGCRGRASVFPEPRPAGGGSR